jgi:hypothetical protein
LIRRARWAETTRGTAGLVEPAMHQIAPGHGELAAGHGDGALMEIDAERQLRRMLDVAEGLHVVGQRDIAEAGRLLGARHRLVDDDRVVIGEIAHEAQQFADRDARLMAGEVDVGDDQRAGIDEGIARNALFALELDDRVEGVPEGSRPTRRQSVSPTLPSACVSANTFETLWIEKAPRRRRRHGPAPSAVTTQSPKRRGSIVASGGI